jgi:hypothetical protein
MVLIGTSTSGSFILAARNRSSVSVSNFVDLSGTSNMALG